MTQEEILNYRKMCAELIGAYWCNDDPREFPNGYWLIDNSKIDLPYRLEDMEFDSDWNWIMPIVTTILELKSNKYRHNLLCIFLEAALKTAKKEKIVEASNQFLIWYNNEHKNQKSKKP